MEKLGCRERVQGTCSSWRGPGFSPQHPIRQPIATCNSISGRSIALFWHPQVPDTQVAHMYLCGETLLRIQLEKTVKCGGTLVTHAL